MCANTFHFRFLWFVICASADNIFCPCPSIEKNCYLWFMPTHFISVYCDLWFMPARTIFFCPCSSIEKIVICDLCQHISGTDRLGCCWLLLLSLSYNRKNCILFILNIVMSYTKEFHLQLCICLFSNEPNTNKISVVFLANRLLAIHFQWFWKEFLACLFSLQEIGMVNLDGICSCCLGLQVGYVNESGQKCGLS